MQKLTSIFLIALIFTTNVQAQTCSPIPEQLERLLTPGKVLFVGETHGTVQMPNSFYDVVCAASNRGLDVLVALEITTELTQDYQRFIHSDESAIEEVRERILSSGTWQSDIQYQDGRRSIAMFNLLESLRELYSENKNIEIFGFDGSFDDPNQHDPNQRDRKMSEKILARVNPDKLVLAYSGWIHSMIEHWTPWSPELGNAAAYVKELHLNTESVRLLHTGGKAWACQGDCGVKEIERTSPDSDRSMFFKKSDGSDKHDWTWNIGKIDASLPAITQNNN